MPSDSPGHPYRTPSLTPRAPPELTTFEEIDQSAAAVRLALALGHLDAMPRHKVVLLFDWLEAAVAYGTRNVAMTLEALTGASVILTALGAAALTVLPVPVRLWMFASIVGQLMLALLLRVRVKRREAIVTRGREAANDLLRYLQARKPTPEEAEELRTGVRVSVAEGSGEEAEEPVSSESNKARREQ